MIKNLNIQAGQYSNQGIKDSNEDSCGIRLPDEEALKYKGIVVAIADGVSSSEAGREASESCVQGFINDYYSTPDTWSVQTSGERVVRSVNSWLYSQGQCRFQSNLGLASTLSILVLKSTTAHLFHVGDSRIYRIRKQEIECLTKDHDTRVSGGKLSLTRAMGGECTVRIDYDVTELQVGDVFVLTTDGIHRFISDQDICAHVALIKDADLEASAKGLVEAAITAGSDDNVTCQMVRIQALPNQDEHEFLRDLTKLPFPPHLDVGDMLDGYRIIKEIHASRTIQVYLVEDTDTGEVVVMKTPSINFDDDPVYIDRFAHEEWIGRSINNPYVFKIHQTKRTRSRLYYITEYLDGQSLEQWSVDNPTPELDKIRDIADQVVKGLRAFHKREMVHQDIKPGNIMIDAHGMLKIIDFGCVHVSGMHEVYTPIEHQHVQGTANYIAPELFEGFEASPRSDQFSLGVMLYRLLSGGKYPYGKQDRARRRKRSDYQSIRLYNQQVPMWMDSALKRAVSFSPENRYDSFSELLTDLSRPNPDYLKASTPLIERNPLTFWRGLSALLLLVIFTLLTLLLSQ